MIIRAPGSFGTGYTPITAAAAVDAIDGPAGETGMDFGVLHLEGGEAYSSHNTRERLFMLLRGAAVFEWDGRQEQAERPSMLEAPPTALHVPAGVGVRIRALGPNTELTVHGAENPAAFAARFVAPEDIRVAAIEVRGLEGTADRIIRTACDDESSPQSNLAVGELITPAGRWSSYPPHHHPHPEIYHYRFFPAGGFGYCGHGRDVYRVEDGDTAVIEPGAVHPQAAAPGYTMIYVWAIRHLEGNRFRGDSRIFETEHAWLLGR